MRLPTWEELSHDEEQLEVLEAPLDKPLFVAGPPGSGKTSLAIWRADALSELYDNVPVVTFNRMLRRSLKLVAHEHDLAGSAATMHSFVANHYRVHTLEQAPTAPSDTYAYRWKIMIKRLMGRGPNSEAIVVDEGQDLPKGFFIYASQCVAKMLTVYADEEQAIGNSNTSLEQIKSAANLPDPIILTENHRNTPEIAGLAEHFHRGSLPAATVMRSNSGDFPQLVYSQDDLSTVRLIVNDFRNRAASIGVIVDQNRTGKDVYELLRKHLGKSRVDFYSSKKKNEDMIDVRKPGVTVLNKESVKGQEFDSVFLLELNRFIPCSSDADYRAMYMMCTRARDRLFLVHGPEPLSPRAEAALPGKSILVRS